MFILPTDSYFVWIPKHQDNLILMILQTWMFLCANKFPIGLGAMHFKSQWREDIEQYFVYFHGAKGNTQFDRGSNNAF